MKGLFAAIVFSLVSSVAIGQIKTVEKFLNDHPELDKYFVYQSTLRMINQEGNHDFNRLIKDIKKINVYVAEGTGEVSLDNYHAMVDDLYAEDFEVLVNAKYEGSTWINMMTKEIGSRSYYVLAVTDSDSFALMEMDGSLDLRYINAIENMNFDELVNMVVKNQDE